ncbi:MAG: transcriptional antiterminator, Rof [Gammaproteobacteria bacterium]|nr:transcriptional antiterminator, Rof [Gammaproteobacteria bacterium]
MTEPNDAAVGYVPISCDLHSEYELAILHRQWLRLVWANGNVIHDEAVLPLDLKATNGEEFLVCRTKDNATQNIRLDRVRRMRAAA